MLIDTSPPPQKHSSIPRLLIYCLLFSTVLHLIFILLLPKYHPDSPAIFTEPTFVSLKEPPAPTDELKKETELDTLKQLETAPPDKTKRIADINRQVEKEMAPLGEDTRDQRSRQLTPESSKSISEPKAITTKQSPQQSVQNKALPADEGIIPQSPLQRSEPAPSLTALTKLSPETLQRIESKEQRERIKKRDDVLAGDEIYLNLQHDYLISFFQRFSNRIESVWNYPATAAQRGEQGILLLKITVTREGELVDVDLLESSGSDALDNEAKMAVYRAAPFGPVTKHWPHEQMKIYAYFQYTLTNRYIFGQ